MEIGQIFRPAIILMISIPGREIDAELQSIFTTCGRNLLDHISSTVSPRAVLYRMLGVLRWPQTESVMMLASQDETFHSCSRCGPHHLFRIKVSGVEDCR